MCGINLLLHNKKISIISLYRPNKVRVSSDDYVSLFKQPQSTGIIAGDFNANHRSWGSTTQSHLQAGVMLLDAVHEVSNIIIRNDGSPTRVGRPNEGRSAVDVTLMSSDLINSSTWEVLDDPCFSDHFPILTTINSGHIVDSCNEMSSVRRWRSDKANWLLYKNIIDNRFSSLEPSLSTNEKLLFLVDTIHNAANATMPKSKPKNSLTKKVLLGGTMSVRK